MKQLRVLMIGAAFSGDLHSDAYSRIREKAKIVGICDQDTARASALAERYGFTGCDVYDDYDVAIADCECDLVDICLPNFLHHDVAVKAMKAGHDIICEKPLATTVEDAQEMVSLAGQLGKHIYYAEDWFFAPAFQKALEIIKSGKVGKPLYIRAREAHSGSHSPFAQSIRLCGGGCMLHLGAHPVSFVLALKENRWTELTAMTSGGGQNNLLHRKMEGEDWGGAFIRFADGTYAALEANYVTAGGMEDVLDIYCEQGCIHVDLSFSGPVKVFSVPGLDYTIEKAEITTGWSRPAVDEKSNLGYCGEIEHFVECARNGMDARVGLRGRDGLETLKVVHLIYVSAQKGIHIRNESLEEDHEQFTF